MAGKVLIIDDDAAVLDSLLRTLHIAGIHCEGEAEPKRALERFRADPADVIVVDYVYDLHPDFTGVDLISEIRKLKPITRAILISGRIDHEGLPQEELQAELQGRIQCDAYFSKPVATDDLVEAIRSALSHVSNQATDWKSIASEYVKGSAVGPDDTRRMNETIKNNLIIPPTEEGPDA